MIVGKKPPIIYCLQVAKILKQKPQAYILYHLSRWNTAADVMKLYDLLGYVVKDTAIALQNANCRIVVIHKDADLDELNKLSEPGLPLEQGDLI